MFFRLIFYLDPPYNKIYENACLTFSAVCVPLTSPPHKTEAIYFCDKDSSIKKCMQTGCPVIAVSHANNPSESLMGTPWLILSPDALSEDFLGEVCYRHYGLPLNITDTARCHLREFTMKDLPALLTLQEENAHNPDGCFFPFHCENSEEYLRNYIQHQYSFYGYGLYAVLHKDLKEFMGIVGFISISSKSADECQNDYEAPGKSSAEVSYGFLRKWQHQGYAVESLTGLLKYGREKNGYEHFHACIHSSNIASLTLAQRCDISIILHT